VAVETKKHDMCTVDIADAPQSCLTKNANNFEGVLTPKTPSVSYGLARPTFASERHF